jgi:putative addiction module CopG family antidote
LSWGVNGRIFALTTEGRRSFERTTLANALTVSLPDELDDFVSRRIREEAYADGGECVRALIRADRRRAVEEKLERLVEDALESGPPEPMTDADWTAMHRALDETGGSH